MTGPRAIEAVDVEKRFGRTPALRGATVVVEEGTLVALLGPSGSGKTTMLRVIAGFEEPDAGTVAIGGRPVAGNGHWEEPEHRRIGMVFQDGALFPHLTVAKNVGFGEATPARVTACLELVGLEARAASYPHELSGGERQRVALARALAPDPAVVLLDEPFASLDAGLRTALREEVAGILRTAGASALLVTHDQQEALSLADELVVMRAGRVEQAGRPEEVYARPTSRWLAEFLGDAEVLPGTAAGAEVTCELGRLPTATPATGAVDVIVRPEAVRVVPAPSADLLDGVDARIVRRAFFGPDQVVVVELEQGRRVRTRLPGAQRWAVGDAVRVGVVGAVATVPPEAPHDGQSDAAAPEPGSARSPGA